MDAAIAGILRPSTQYATSSLRSASESCCQVLLNVRRVCRSASASSRARMGSTNHRSARMNPQGRRRRARRLEPRERRFIHVRHSWAKTAPR